MDWDEFYCINSLNRANLQFLTVVTFRNYVLLLNSDTRKNGIKQIQAEYRLFTFYKWHLISLFPPSYPNSRKASDGGEL